MLYELFVANFFTPTQSLASNIRGLSVTSNLNLLSSLRLNRVDLLVSQRLYIHDYWSKINSVKLLTISNQLFLNQSIFKGPYIDPIVHWISFWQQAKIVPYEKPVSNLGFSQSIVVTKAKKPVLSTLSFSQTVSYRKVANLTVTNTLNIVTRQTGYLPTPSYVQGINNYAIVPQARVIIQSLDASDTLELRRPEFGDSERYEASRIMRRTRAGTLLMFRENYWPTSRTLNYSFSYLCPGTGQKLIAFLQKYLGRSFHLTTHEGILWVAVCMTPAAELIQQVRGGQAITLEFQIYPP